MNSFNYLKRLEQKAEQDLPLPKKCCPAERRVITRLRERHVKRMLDRLKGESGMVLPI
jgi:hypothetical protein